MKKGPSWLPTRSSTVLTPLNAVRVSGSQRKSSRIINKTIAKESAYELEQAKSFNDDSDAVVDEVMPHITTKVKKNVKQQIKRVVEKKSEKTFVKKKA